MGSTSIGRNRQPVSRRRQLQVFVEMRQCSTIVTSRPVGYQRLPPLSGEWATGTLAEFSSGQQRAFATSWMQFRLANSVAGTDEAAISQRAIAEVERFEAEIERTPGLHELSGIPLLLGILIYLNSSSLPLPRTRFQAYRRMVDHLIADHPRARQLAASVRDGVSTFSADDLRNILAALAFRISTDNPEGAIERTDALRIVREFLCDTELGFGYEANAARQAAERVIVDGETNLGLLVERAPGLCSFVHRAFQEHLAATSLASMPFENQLKHIEERSADPQWHDVILGLTHLTTRPQDVRQIVERLRNTPKDNIAKFGIDTILCEIAVGPFHCPPDVCLDLCSTFVREVELGAWMPHRLALLRLLLGGIYSSKSRDHDQRAA